MGFFQVINHVVPILILEETVNAIKAFHEQPQEVKANYYKREEGKDVMYSSNNDLYRTKAASWHDSLQVWMGPEPPEVEELQEICRKEVVAWDLHATNVAETVMELLSEGLGLQAGKFKELTFSEKRALVGHCYPYCPQPDRTVGITSHTDPGIVTILLQNHVPGLQVRHEDEWVDVEAVPGGLIINVGDMLQIISNGDYKIECATPCSGQLVQGSPNLSCDILQPRQMEGRWLLWTSPSAFVTREASNLSKLHRENSWKISIAKE